MNNLKKIVAIATIVSSLLMTAGPVLAITAEELQAQINTLMAQLATLQAQLATLQGTPTVTGCTISSFDRNLKQGMSGDDVKCLQIVLNSSADTQLASSGVGSSGNETSYFGPLTKAAVIKFQEKYASDCLASWGLTTGTGFVGSTTRAKLNSILTGAVVPTGCNCTNWANIACGGGTCLTTQRQQTRTCTPATAGACEGVVTTQCVADATCAVAEGLTVALASDTPAGAVLPDGATGVTMTKINLTASSDSDVIVQGLSTYRSGVGTPSNIASVYLYDGDIRITTSGKTVNTTTNKTIFTNLGFVVPKGTTKTLSIVVDILANAADSHAMGIAAAADITTDGAAVSGTFPIMGNTMSINNVTIGTVTTARAGSATYTRTIGEKEAIVAKFTLTTANEDSELKRLAIYNNGTDILDNMTLWRGSEKLATATEKDRYFTFVLDTPNAITKGESITYTLKADVYSVNVSNTALLYIKNDADILVVGKTYGYGVDVTNTAYDGSDATEYTTVALEAGDVTITSSGPSAQDVAVDQDNVTLMNLSIIALNDTRVEQFGFDFTATGGLITNAEVVDAEFYCDGIGLISSTSVVVADQTWTDDFDLEAGKTYNCLVRMDLESTAGATDTIYATIDISDWSFRDVNTDTAFTYTSTNYTVVPSGDLTGYTMTVKAASLAVAAATSPASQIWVRGGQGIATAGYTFTAGSADDVLVQDITFTACYGASTGAGKCGAYAGNYSSSTILSVSLYEGTTTRIGTARSIDSSGNIVFTDLNWEIPASATKTLTVKANYNTSLPNSATAYVSIGLEDDTVTAYYDEGNKTMSDTLITGNDSDINCNAGSGNYDLATGIYQTILNSGTLAADIPTTTPATTIAVAGSTGVKFSEVKLTATREDFTVSKMAFRNISSGYDDNIAKIWVKYPTNATATTTETKECILASGIVTCSGLNVLVPNPDISGNKKYATVEVLVDMQTIAGGADAGESPEFIPYLGADWEAIGKSSGAKLYEADTSSSAASITITDVIGAGTDSTKTLATDITATSTSVVADADISAVVSVGDIICIDTNGAAACDSDKMFVTAVSTVTMTVVRGVNGTTAAASTAADANDGILYFTNIMTDVNPMNVQGTKLTVVAGTPAHGGQNATEEVMKFTIEANVAGDANIRKGSLQGAATAEIGGGTLSAETSPAVDGSSDKLILSAAGDAIVYDAGVGFTSNYSRVNFMVYTDDAGAQAIALSAWKLSTHTAADAPGDDIGALPSLTTIDNYWINVDMAIPVVGVIDPLDRYLIIEVDALGNLAATDFIILDQVILYNEKINIDLSLNADVTTNDTKVSYLKQNGITVATAYADWTDAGSTATGTLTFIPVSTFGTIEISGLDIFTVEIDTTVFTDSTATENLTLTIDLGNSATAGDIYWYDVEGSDNVTYVGVNATDKISNTNRY